MNDMTEPAFSFDDTSEALIPAIIAKYPEGKQASAVMPLLDLAQRQMARQTGHAWVPRAAMDAIARRLSMPSMRV
ncbi:NAD(P)H-dependent oxidoreductase subunit E, partial [Pseudomonas aeruginosa]|uniref:NAD(P)H-dependent oxidoreductase subunit E n=2 Tax=Pseudomonadota TaxID=1224 RepID=UPI002B226864